jgi:hypothetical protein
MQILGYWKAHPKKQLLQWDFKINSLFMKLKKHNVSINHLPDIAVCFFDLTIPAGD